MEIWIIRDGEKTGPFHDFEVRRQIEAGQLAATTPAWHEGLAAWQPLGEIEIFRREFERASAPSETPEIPPLPEVSTAPPVAPPPPPPRYARRFWARWFDLCLYSGLWWLAMWGASQNIEAALTNTWVMFFHYLPWFVFEALMIHHWGTTPGKWLLGLRVTNLDQSRLDLAAATKRSARVLFTGIGFGWQLLSVFCQALSWFTARRLGTTLWDHVGGHRVDAQKLSPLRVVSFLVIFMAAVQLQSAVLMPVLLKELISQRPEWKEYFEQNPPWQLPNRSPNK
jgi:uncharacterized RDD family membrane protein YckC